MTTEKLHELHKAQPFSPFTVHLADGRSLRVDHPELLAHARGARTAVALRPDDTMEVFDLLLVTGLQVGNAKRPPGRPPERRQRRR